MDGFETPNDIARELGVSPKRVRDYLREKYGLLAAQSESRWLLDGARAADVRQYFSQGA